MILLSIVVTIGAVTVVTVPAVTIYILSIGAIRTSIRHTVTCIRHVARYILILAIVVVAVVMATVATIIKVEVWALFRMRTHIPPYLT